MRNADKSSNEKAVALKVSSKNCFKYKSGHYAKDCGIRLRDSNKEVCCFKYDKMDNMTKSCNAKTTKNKKSCNICKISYTAII